MHNLHTTAPIPTTPPPCLPLAAFMMLRDQVGQVRLARPDDELYAVTLTPRDGAVMSEDDEHHLWRLASEWNRALDIGFLGFSRHRLSEQKQFRPIYFLLAQEGAATWHYHGVVSVPQRHVEALERSAMALWHRMTDGSMVIEPLLNAGWLAYVTRLIRPGSALHLRVLPKQDPRDLLSLLH